MDWPTLCARMALIAKRDGGLGLIAMLASIARLQGRLRRHVVRTREAYLNRNYIGKAAVKCAEEVAWQQATWDEWAGTPRWLI